MAAIFREKSVLLVLLVLISMVILWSASNLYTDPMESDEQLRMAYGEVAKDTNVIKACDTLYNISEWSPPSLPEKLQNADQDNADLANALCEKWIIPPFIRPRQLTSPAKVDYSQRRQSTYVDKLLKHRRNGFYIECGAANGEGLSNSLFFEKDRNWSGLLIEANPVSFKSVLHTRRHAHMVNACLSPKRTPTLLNFTLAGYLGGLTDLIEPSHQNRIQYENDNKVKHMKIQCFPLVSILRALNITHVDYFSLDIEGAELDILNTFPFDEIRVDVITVEYAVSSDRGASWKKLADINKLLVDKFGYYITSFYSDEDVMLAKGV